LAEKGDWLSENTVDGSQLIERNYAIQKGKTELKASMSASSSYLTATGTVTSSFDRAPLPALLKR
jgi:hypothetical protein